MKRFVYAWLVFLFYVLLTSGVHAIFHIPYILLHILFGLSYYFLYGLKGAFYAAGLIVIIMLFGFIQLWFLSDVHTAAFATELLHKMSNNGLNALFFIIMGTLTGYGVHVVRRIV